MSHRLGTIALSAEANDRHTALVGRSLWKMYEVAKEHGYLLDVPEFLSEKDVGYLPNDKIVMICTGFPWAPILGSPSPKIFAPLPLNDSAALYMLSTS